MPHIRFRAVKDSEVKELSTLLSHDLANAMGTAEDNFTFEHVETHFYTQGKKTASYPFVEVLWFERPQEIQNASAQIITNHLKKLGKYEDVVVVFHVLPKSSYYENGTHF